MSPPQNLGPGTPWRQSLRPASFRGVPFFTKNAGSDQGRRTAVHEFPLRDVPYVEDLGLKGRAFTLEAYVLGADYMRARDALIWAIETPGAGTLVHPYRGALNVALTSPAHITESADEGGMARFSLTFTETGSNVQPAVRPDTPALVDTSAYAAKEALNTALAKSFNVVGVADYIAQAAKGIVNSALDLVTQVSNLTSTGPLADLMYAAQTLSGSLAILMQSPQMLASGIQGQIYALAALAQTPRDAWNALQTFLNGKPLWKTPFVSLTTPSGIQQSLNQTAVADLVRRTALVEAARASSQMTFTSYNESLAVLTILAGALDAELESTAMNATGLIVPLDDDVYDALLDLRTAVVRDITARGANLAKLTTVTLPRTMPALVAAYRIYGDCTMDADIVARNNIRHPGFLPGGKALEILAQ